MRQPTSDDLAGRTVLVTGGIGFIGSHLARHLLRTGATVVVADIDVAPGRRSLLHEPAEGGLGRLEIVQLDVCHYPAVERLVSSRRFDLIFHLAGYSVIERSTQFPYESLQTNTMGTLHVLEAVRHCDHQPRRVVITSTDKVYGEMDGPSYREDSPLRGVGLYDAGKLAADVIALTYSRTFDTPVSVLRLCNVFGPHDYNSGYRLFPKSLGRIFDPVEPAPPVLYYQSIGHWRDYVYIDDVVAALIATAIGEPARGEVFNMAPAIHIATPVLIKRLVDESVAVLRGIDPARASAVERNGILVTTAEQSALTIQRQHLDSSKITSMLRFHTQVPFAEGLRRTVEHHAASLVGRLAAVS
jgi:nucleoside-diphosphate-sugar epimerase